MSARPTVADLLAEGTRTLAAPNTDSAGSAPLDAQLLLAQALAVARARLHSHPEVAVEEPQAAAYRLLLRRRAAGEPLAYLTGRREFWSLELQVTPAVLVPRPETELLVERALALGPPGAARVADLGTGSGAIALALARERPAWQLVATDASAASLEVARRNSAALGTGNVEFRHGDWYAALPPQRFALLISNPPYVAAGDPALAALRFEPPQALSPGADGLEALAVLVRGAAAHLERGGWLLLEHGAAQGMAVRGELVAAGFRHVRSHRDLGGHERMTEGQYDQI